jgi:rhamnose transport system permease protein
MTTRIRQFIPYLLPIALLLAATWLVTAQAARYGAILNMWRPWGEIGTLSIVMTAIILTGGIDLSVGSIIALASVCFGLAWQAGWSPTISSAVALLVGLTAGAINGWLVVAGIKPLVATLATMAFYAGAAMTLSRGQRIAGLPESFCELGQGSWTGVPNQLVFFAIATLLGWIVVHHTRFGRYLYAIGENREAATFAAVPVRRIEWSLYAVNGLTAAWVALIYVARGGAVVPTPNPGIELQAIACVVLGGTRVTGGQGGIGRTVLGVTILSLLDIGLQFVSWLTGDARLMLVGALVIGLAIWNERWTDAVERPAIDK